MNRLQCLFFMCLASAAISGIAQEPVPAQTPTVDSRTENPAADVMAFRRELNALKLSPEQRIAAIDAWRKTNGNPLAALRPERSSSNATAMTAALIARQKQAALSVFGTDNERELAALQLDVAAAIGEMRSYDVSPEKRIRMFDEFQRANREVFQEIRNLRKAISDRRMENAPAPVAVQPVPGSEAEAALQGRWNAILQEIATRRNANKQLTPEERIAAMDRDRAFFQERANSLRELAKEFQTSARGQTNDPNPNPR